MIAYLLLGALIVAVPLWALVMDALTQQAWEDAFWDRIEERNDEKRVQL